MKRNKLVRLLFQPNGMPPNEDPNNPKVKFALDASGRVFDVISVYQGEDGTVWVDLEESEKDEGSRPVSPGWDRAD